MQHWAETDLAWDLADALGYQLTEDSRAQLYAAIGAGNPYTAIVTLLSAAGDTSALARPLLDRIGDWLDTYRHSADAPGLRDSLDRSAAAARSGESEQEPGP